jgi:hypothetical protein
MEAPTQQIFNEMRTVASEIWNTYDNTYGYATQKLSYVNSIENIEDNAMVFYRMFDYINQQKMKSLLSQEALTYINNNN